MSKITRVEIFQVDLKPHVQRGDAIQSFHTHATAVGAITSLALCAIDSALWDMRCRKAGLPLHVMAGGAQKKVPIYDTEGGWLHFPTGQVVDNALTNKARGFRGVKIKVGKPHVSEDVKRLTAVRKAIGDEMELMVDANQGFTIAEAIRRARHYEEFDLAWFEEPLPAEDLNGHVLLLQSTSLPIAVGESIYSISHFREYMQLGVIMKNEMRIDKGYAYPYETPGLGIEWNWKAIDRLRVAPPVVLQANNSNVTRRRTK